MPYRDCLVSPYSISMRQLFLTDEGIQAQRGKVTFSRQHSMGSVTTRREPWERRKEVRWKENGSLLLRLCSEPVSSAPRMWSPTGSVTPLSFVRRRSDGRERRSLNIDGKIYEDAKKAFPRKNHSNRFGRQDVKRCRISGVSQGEGSRKSARMHF